MAEVKGQGSIIQLEKDKPKSKCRKWQLRASVGMDPRTGKYKTRTRRFSGTYTQAKAALREFIAEIEDNRVHVRAGTTFKEMRVRSSAISVWVTPLARAKARWCLRELPVMSLPMSALQDKSRDGVATNGWRRSGLPQGWQCHKNRAGCPKADTQVGISGHLARKADLGIGRRIPRSVFAASKGVFFSPEKTRATVRPMC